MGIQSKLLFNSRPLVIVPELAVLIGLSESIILQQIHYWIQINKEADRNFIDGFYWTYNSVAEWQKQFPFFSTKTIQRCITKMENSGLLVSGNHNKASFDRTKWYRIDFEVLESILNASQNPETNISNIAE